MLEPISQLQSQTISPSGAYAQFGGVRFGAAAKANQGDSDGDQVMGGGPKRSSAGGKAQPVTGEDRVEISRPEAAAADDTDAGENVGDEQANDQSVGLKSAKYSLGFFMEDILPFALGFVSIGSGPVGWMMFPVLVAAGYAASRVGRKLKQCIDESEVTGIAARILRMKKMFANPQLIKNGEALTTLESTIGLVCNPIFSVIRNFPGGGTLLDKLGLAEGVKLSGTQGLGRFITEKALDRAMIFNAAAEGSSMGDAVFRSGKMGILLGAGNWIAKMGNTLPKPFSWIFKLIGFAIPLFGLKKPSDESKGAAPQQA